VIYRICFPATPTPKISCFATLANVYQSLDNLICILNVISTVHCQDYAYWVIQSRSMSGWIDPCLGRSDQQRTQLC